MNDSLQSRRIVRWHQTPDTHIPTPEAATRFIEQAGIVTLYPVSPEIPNLFHAYVGDPNAKTSPKWDSPSGHVYGWRWTLGRANAGFYAPIVRGRSAFVAWDLVSAILCLRGVLHTPDELYDLGRLSDNAYRITQALEERGGELSTGELRKAAGFPVGKEQRAAFGKAIAELDARLMLVKTFSNEHDDLNHGLIQVRLPNYAEEADAMTREEALHRFLTRYLPSAVYTVPAVLAKHMTLPEPELRTRLDRLVEEGTAAAQAMEGQKGLVYVWT